MSLHYLTVLNNIHNYLDYQNQQVEVFRNNRLLFKLKRFKMLKNYIKENMENPSRNIKIWIVTYVLDRKDPKYPFRLSADQITITPDLELVTERDDKGKVITYSPEDLLNYGFKRSQLKNIFKAIREMKISLGRFDTQNYGKLVKIMEK